MANTFIQGSASTTTLAGPTVSLAFPGSVTARDLLVTTLRHGSPASVVNSVTDNMGVGNVWTVVYDTLMGSGVNGAWAYTFTNGSGACTVSWNLASNDPGCVIEVAEWRGPNGVRATPAGVVSTTATTLTTNSVTAVAGDLLVAVFGIVSGSTAAVVPGAGFTLRESGTSGTSTFAAITDNLSATAGSQTTSLTLTGAQTGAISGLGAFSFNAVLSGSGSGSAVIWMPNPLTSSVNF